MEQYQPHIHEYKRREVEDVVKLFHEYPVVGIVNMEGLSAHTLQRMKKRMRGKTVFKITRKQFIQIAMDQIKDKKNISQLKEKLEGIPALLFTKEEPFTLYKLLEKSKTPAAAKPGQKAPFDITIPAGPTPFTPGPMIGELGQLGIKTEVKEGKISVREDKTVVQEGEVINQKVAELLAKLSIEPMKLGLNLLLTYQDGEVLTKDVLFIDEDKYRNNIIMAHAQAFALAQHLGIINKDTVKPLVARAHTSAKFIAEKYNITTPETVGKQLLQAEQAAETIKEKLPEPPAHQEIPKEEPKQEAKSQQEKKADVNVVSASMNDQQSPQFQHQRMADGGIESRKPVEASEMETAEKFLKELTERAIKVEGSKKADPRIQPTQDISKLIDQLKDKKSRGEL